MRRRRTRCVWSDRSPGSAVILQVHHRSETWARLLVPEITALHRSLRKDSACRTRTAARVGSHRWGPAGRWTFRSVTWLQSQSGWGIKALVPPTSAAGRHWILSQDKPSTSVRTREQHTKGCADAHLPAIFVSKVVFCSTLLEVPVIQFGLLDENKCVLKSILSHLGIKNVHSIHFNAQSYQTRQTA